MCSLVAVLGFVGRMDVKASSFFLIHIYFALASTTASPGSSSGSLDPRRNGRGKCKEKSLLLELASFVLFRSFCLSYYPKESIHKVSFPLTLLCTRPEFRERLRPREVWGRTCGIQKILCSLRSTFRIWKYHPSSCSSSILFSRKIQRIEK